MDSVSIMGSMLGSVITDRKLRLAEVYILSSRFLFLFRISLCVFHIFYVPCLVWDIQNGFVFIVNVSVNIY